MNFKAADTDRWKERHGRGRQAGVEKGGLTGGKVGDGGGGRGEAGGFLREKGG